MSDLEKANISVKRSTSRRSAVSWNLLSVIFCGICGFLLLMIVGGWYGPAIFGAFNQVYAWYIVFSQLGAFGIHLSMVKHLAENDDSVERRRIVFVSGMGLSFVLGLFFAILLWILGTPVGRFLDSPDVGYGIQVASFGVFFFSMNKCLLFSLNGLSLLKEYALFQMLRYALMLAALFVLILSGVDGRHVPFLFPVAEGCLFLSLVFFFRRDFSYDEAVSQKVKEWVRYHFRFGSKAFTGHILLDLNTRVDVLFLGFFTDDKTVGIYSMAAILAEAALQLPLVFRTVYTPTIVKCLAGRRFEELSALVRGTRMRMWGLMLFVSVAGYLFVDTLLPLLTGRAEYRAAAPLYLILMAGITVASGYVPFGLILVNGGFPGVQSLMVVLIVTTNTLGNLFLIPFWGNMGAAVATTLANILSVVLLKFFARRCLCVSV